MATRRPQTQIPRGLEGVGRRHTAANDELEEHAITGLILLDRDEV